MYARIESKLAIVEACLHNIQLSVTLALAIPLMALALVLWKIR